jgi:hypothetical protein
MRFYASAGLRRLVTPALVMACGNVTASALSFFRGAFKRGAMAATGKRVRDISFSFISAISIY